jgi:hypothetical protein
MAKPESDPLAVAAAQALWPAKPVMAATVARANNF